MSAYLKRLDIAEVDESSAQLGAYIKRVHIVEVVDSDGNPWEPVPPVDPIELAEGQGANWVGTNVYEIGQTVEARTAAFTGGLEPVTYRYRFQTKAVGSDSWVSESWTTTTNAKNPVFFNITAPGQVKFQSQARDASDPVLFLNSNTGIKTVAQTTIGTVTINPDTTAVSTMGSATFSVVVTGGDAEDLTYKWSVRSGAAQLDSSDTEASVTYTFIGGESAQIQCTVSSANASNSPQTNLSFVLIS